MATQTGLSCPKCGGRMHGYERTHVQVEQCEECRGIFLDHGELERLIEAEGGGWSGLVGGPVEGAPAPRPDSERALSERERLDHEKALRDLFGVEKRP